MIEDLYFCYLLVIISFLFCTVLFIAYWHGIDDCFCFCLFTQLLDSFQKTFPTLNFPPLPERGDFDLRDVLESPYFFN